MAENIETRISSEQAKEAIYKINKLSEKGMTPEQIADAIENVSQTSSSASEIDMAVKNSLQISRIHKSFDKASILNAFGKAINILGDSHTVGIGASKAFTCYKEILRNKIATKYGNLNFGIDASIGYQTLNGFTKYTNNANSTTKASMTGMYIEIINGVDFPIIESSAYTPVEMTNKKVKFLCPISEIGKTFQVYGWTGSESGAATLTVGINGLTNEYAIANYNQIRVRNTDVSNPLKLETYYIYDDINYYTLFNFANTGRALAYCDNAVIDKWFDNAEIAILALSTNDGDIVKYKAKLDYIASKYNSQKFTKLVILDLDSLRPNTHEIRVALRELQSKCKGSLYISVSDSLSPFTVSVAELKSMGIIGNDNIHYTNSGHNMIADLVYNSIFGS